MYIFNGSLINSEHWFPCKGWPGSSFWDSFSSIIWRLRVWETFLWRVTLKPMTAMRTDTKEEWLHSSRRSWTSIGRKCIFFFFLNRFCRDITNVPEQLEFTENSHPLSMFQLLLQLSLQLVQNKGPGVEVTCVTSDSRQLKICARPPPLSSISAGSLETLQSRLHS